MHKQIKQAFAPVKAEEQLKEDTLRFIQQKISAKQKSVPRLQKLRLASVCMLLLCFCVFATATYFSPTCVVSIDINPSIELTLNRFNTIISVKGYNEDGIALASVLDVQYKNYNNALQDILQNEEILRCMQNNETLSITVAAKKQTQNDSIVSYTNTCINQNKNASCHQGDAETIEQAHALGLSVGKYQAFLTLKSLDPTVTAQEIQTMTMREIRDRINALQTEGENPSPGNGNHQHKHQHNRNAQ